MPNYCATKKGEEPNDLSNLLLATKISDALNKSSGNGKILVSINLNSKHWVGIVTEKDIDQIIIHYMNSELEVIPPFLQEALLFVLARDYPSIEVKVVNDPVEKQISNNCGSEVIENFMLYLTGERYKQEDVTEFYSMLYEQNLIQGIDNDMAGV